MKTTKADQAVANLAVDALFGAVAGYRTALAARAEDPQAFERAEVALKAAIGGSAKVLQDLEALFDASDVEVLEGMLEQVNQSASRASAAVDEALTIKVRARRRERPQAIEVDIDDV